MAEHVWRLVIKYFQRQVCPHVVLKVRSVKQEIQTGTGRYGHVKASQVS